MNRTRVRPARTISTDGPFVEVRDMDGETAWVPVREAERVAARIVKVSREMCRRAARACERRLAREAKKKGGR